MGFGFKGSGFNGLRFRVWGSRVWSLEGLVDDAILKTKEFFGLGLEGLG